MNLKVKHQKYLFLSFLIILNGFLSFCIFHWWKYWYIYLVILTPSALFNVIMIMNLVITSPYYVYKNEKLIPYDKKSVLFLIPCYNESYEELYENIDALVNQKNIDEHDKLMVIICDGKVHGGGNNKKTNEILLDIFGEYISNHKQIDESYITWHDQHNNTNVYDGVYKNIPFIIIVKEHNMGKRDSLYVIRRFCLEYNNEINDTNPLYKYLYQTIYNYGINNIDAIIGTDGDTVFDLDCSRHLMDSLYGHNDHNVMGVCGYIKISKHMKKLSIWTIFQHTEYKYSQITKRLHQSRFTKKVSCLPGCVQILKVSNETCGTDILDEFNKLPKEKAILTHHIRSYASEDRNHVCLMLHMYPHVKTKQTFDAIAYTRIPTNLNVLLSQRRRWSLGATTNDLILISKKGILLFEKLSAFVNVLAWFFTIFIMVATVSLIIQIAKIENFSDEDLVIKISIYAVSVVIILPMLYLLICPLWLKLTKIEIIQLYIGILIWYLVGIILVFIIHLYTLFHIDDFSWGKTRINKKQTQNLNVYQENNFNENLEIVTP